MRNWPKSKRTIWQSLRIKTTRKIFQIVDKIEIPETKTLEKWKILNNLKSHAARELQPRDSNLIACPEAVKVELENIGLSDLFFPEEFESLQKGLNKLISKYTFSSMGISRDDLNAWFSNINNYTFESASTLYVGSILFSNKNDNEPIQFLHSAQICLKYIPSSFITLSASVKPSAKFIKGFNSIIKSTPISQSEILGIDFKHGFISLSIPSPWYTREAELEKLFLELNRSVVVLFRETFRAGLSRFGPLPSIEVISTNISLKEIPLRAHTSKASKEFLACSKFFHSLGYPSSLYRIYKDEEWWSLYEVYRNELFYKNFHSYQVLISLVDAKKIELFGEDKGSLVAAVFDKIHEFLHLLALEHFYETLRSLTIGIKNELEPNLSGLTQGKIKVKNLESGTMKMVVLNSLHFYHSRIWIGVDSAFFSHVMNRDIRSLYRKQHKSENSVLLIDDIKFNIENNKRFCEQQLSLLKLTYSQILSYKSTSLNYLLQQNTFLLSILVAILTVITIIPEDTRTTLAIKLWNWFINLL